MFLYNYLTSFLCRLYPVASWWLNLTETLPPTCMFTIHNAPYLSHSVTTPEPHGRLVRPLSPPPGRPWPSFLKNALRAMGYLVLSTQAVLKVYFPHLCMLLNDAIFRWNCYRQLLCATKQEMVHSIAALRSAGCERLEDHAIQVRGHGKHIAKGEMSFLIFLVLSLIIPLCCKH
jgi:hypothetical protein